MSNFEKRKMNEMEENVKDDIKEFPYKVNVDYILLNLREECYREKMVSFYPMFPLIERGVPFRDADYILYMHSYARIRDMSSVVLRQLEEIANNRKEGAEIIVVGKAANIESILNGRIDNITFWGDHFTEKLGKKFGLDMEEQYFVYDSKKDQLNIWPVDGCLRKCNFCRRTYMDIKFESLSLDDIKMQLDFYQNNMPDKMKKISLRAENLTEYGIDIYGKQMLHELINLISSYSEVKEIELPIGMCISEITSEILDSLCRCNQIKTIALNLEAGSNRLLSVIGKGHTCGEAIHIFQMLRKAHPNIYIETTVMLGLPTEEIMDVIDLAHLIVSCSVDLVLCNYYGMVLKHPLAKLPQISERLREYHLKIFFNTLKSLERERNLTAILPTIYKRGTRKTERILETLRIRQEYYDNGLSNMTYYYLDSNLPEYEEEKSVAVKKLKK